MDKPPVITPTPAVDASVASLSKDISSFATNRRVPKELGLFVDAPEDSLEDWYEELSKAWNERESTPTPEEAAILVLESLRKLYHPCPFEIADVQGFLSFYELPNYYTLPKPTPPVEASPVTKDAQEGLEESGMPNGVEAREKLAKMVDGKCLMIKVLYLDEQLRCVGDAYYNGICLQDKLRTGESATCHDHTPGVSEENTLTKRG